MVYRSSFNQWKVFKQCPYSWYLQKVLKVEPEVSDLSYLHRGSLIHDCIEEYYKGKIDNKKIDIQTIKEKFEKGWKKYKLDQSNTLKTKKDESWLMVVNGVNLDLGVTSTELKIFKPEFLGYLDLVCTRNDSIIDWKSSTRSQENEEEYSHQLMLYAWYYKQVVGRWPQTLQVYYLKYSGSRGVLDVPVDKEKIEALHQDYIETCSKMEQLQMGNIEPEKCSTCFHFCPYKKHCELERQKQDSFVIEEKGWYCKTNFNDAFLEKHLAKKFTCEAKNAIFVKKHYPNAKTKHTLYSIKNKTFPTGLWPEVRKTLNDYIKFKNLNKTVIFVPKKTEKPKTMEDLAPICEKLKTKSLRDYQQKAVESIMDSPYRRNILALATGGGKTLVAAELIRIFNEKTLFIVDRIELLKQTKKVFEEELGIKCGEIQGDTIDRKQVTIATIQSLLAKKDILALWLAEQQFVIIDESHKINPFSYFEINKYFRNLEEFVGLTATPFRDDGLTMFINSVAGYPSYVLETKQLIDMGHLIKPVINFVQDFDGPLDVREINKQISEELKEKNIDPDEEKNKSAIQRINYKYYIQDNEFRNNAIKKIVDKHKEDKILILVKYVEHGNALSALLDAPYIHGSLNKDDRKDIFDAFTNDDSGVLIGTYSIFSEGIDIPNINILINACANVGSIKTIQMLGRGLRTSKGKTDCYYYDFYDNYSFFKRASIARMRTLKKQGHKNHFLKLL